MIREESAYYGRFSEGKGTEIDAWIEISKLFEQGSLAKLSAEALCAETAMIMLGRYAGDPGFDKKHIDRLIGAYRDKLPLLIKYDA